VVVVDDIIDTGVRLQETVKLLKGAGARQYVALSKVSPDSALAALFMCIMPLSLSSPPPNIVVMLCPAWCFTPPTPCFPGMP
jgi:predicted phosphoribosyltransferase